MSEVVEAQTVLVVDCRTRGMEVFTASATSLSERQGWVVLRKAASLGPLRGIASEEGVYSSHPIIIMGEYAARSSSGFVSPVANGRHKKITIAGGAGFGFFRDSERVGDALRPFAVPVEGVILPEGTTIKVVSTHRNSNPSTATAAAEGLFLLAEVTTDLVVMEGQSDQVSGFRFLKPEEPTFAPRLSEEHQKEFFTKDSFLKAALRRVVRSKFRKEYEDPPIGDDLRREVGILASRYCNLEVEDFGYEISETLLSWFGKQDLKAMLSSIAEEYAVTKEEALHTS